MEDCIFCKIAAKDIESEVVFEDDQAVAFRDLNPRAPYHYLVIPRTHIPTLNDAGPEQEPLLGHLLKVAVDVAAQFGFENSGYRVVVNCNRHGGQEVFHLHVHLLGGRQMSWPPG
ncbi:MAG: histidine triad nucleotide-binding protein [Armatimonadota bacterium]